MSKEPTRYVRINENVWRTESETEKKISADELARHSWTINFPVRSWTSVREHVVRSPNLDPEDRLVGEPGQRLRVNLVLDTSRRRLHTISEKGVQEILGDLTLQIFGARNDAELGGSLRHWPVRKRGDAEDHPEDVLGTILFPMDDVRSIIERFEAGQSCVVSLRVRIFKKQIAWSFDEDWMSQNFYLIPDEQVLVSQCSLSFGEPDVKDQPDEPPAGAIVSAASFPTMGSKQLNWIAALLGLIVLILLFK